MQLLFHDTTISIESVSQVEENYACFPAIGSDSCQSIFNVSSYQSSLNPINCCYYSQLTIILLKTHQHVQNVLYTLLQLNQNRSHLILQSGTQGESYNLKNETPSYLVFQEANFIQLPFTKPEF